MPEKTWTTLIAITCSNQELQSWWEVIENDLRLCVYRLGWNTRDVAKRLQQIHEALTTLGQTTLVGGDTFSRRKRR